ncbi:MAG TPA: bifunctional nuclease domain-containing protein [Ktedonobacteraceae bacterium]
MDHITDAELVAKVREGDKEAFGQLVERYQQMVERIARKMIADEWIAHELAQESILQAYLSLKHLRDASRFKSWLYGITLNMCRSHLHDRQRDILSLETIIGGLHNDTVIGFDDTVDPQTVAEAHDLHRLVLQAIDDLSSKDKEATLLFYYEQLTLQEIAAFLGVSVGTIKGRLHRARKQLQIRLPSEYVPERRKRQGGRMSMRQVTIDAVREHPDTRQSFVVLKDEYDKRLVIWIGKAEALTIAAGLTGVSPPRPMTAHLMASLFDVTGIQLKEVRIEACKDDIFYAVISISNENGEHDLDARPSDALALAVLMKRPMYVAEDIMERIEKAAPQSQVELLTEFRDIDRDVVLNEHKEQKDNLIQLIASLTRSNLESDLQRDKEKREQTKQELIASWKEERKQNQQEM